MKKTILCSVALGLVVFGSVGTASAINCEQVRKYLKTGRTADQIAETMVVDVAEVKACEAGGGDKAAEKGAAPKDTPGAK